MRHSRALSQGVAACSVAALVAAAMAGPAGGASQQRSSSQAPESYLVLTPDGRVARTPWRAKLKAQGAKVTSVNQRRRHGRRVRSADADFRDHAAAIAGVKGVACERVIGP